MPTYDPLIITQPSNKLTEIATFQRNTLNTRNDYKNNSNEYSATNPNALADGDLFGKGTGGDLDVNNRSAGSSRDILERNTNIVKNPYKPNTPYTTPSA